MNKRQLRSEMRALRAQLPKAAQKAASLAAAQRIETLAPYQNAKTVMAYMAVRGELDLSPLIGKLLSGGKCLALPRCEAPGVMTAREVSSLKMLEPGAFAVPEPSQNSRIIPAQEIDLILVPGTAFGRDGSRLGQGAGYYDRFLPQTRAYRVGICHGFALLSSLPMQEHDIYMDAVITPDALIIAGKKQEE